jgi:acetyl-CoA carboxylase biotin carboxyl carrier protein
VSTFNLKDLAAILEMLDKHQVSEFKLDRGDEKLFLRRGKTVERRARAPQLIAAMPPLPSNVIPLMNAVQQNIPLQQQAPQQLGQVPREVAVAAAQTVAAAAVDVVPKKALKEITSPMVGTFYRRPAVDAEPYVQVGDSVKKGDVLCIVEAMKLMNEIECETVGKIVEVCLEDGQMVEYGEVLFRVDPI